MSPSQFIPARSSRHRIACVALYRALIREARAVPLPDDVLRKGTQHPIPRLVKKAFARNRTETSYRIVFSALGTGYNDGEPPAYVSPRFPVPRENLTGARRVPYVAITAEGIAFLRQKKLQDHSVALYIQHKTKVKRRTMTLLLSSMREDITWAAEEDRWEEIVKREMYAAQRQGARKTSARAGRPDDLDRSGREMPDKLKQDESYGQMVLENWRFASNRLTSLMEQQAARAKAFVEIHKAEKEMLDKENQAYLSMGHRWMVDTPEKKMQRHKKFRMDFRAAKIERKAKRREKNKWQRVRGLEPAPVGV
ncbi:uncharacterized protein ColSpa_12514 [Colletotrichum spaethianum]|uniref:Uncharacterized protein n=1 Tax=Colletotrichum spaethianum TaxID=700344 RepID=A0AA37PHL3_9PEZI|nr:uncharacterized protein ColSpa_12514 [Colletotrichum spaethianum]GKT52333.1 hypothetical protein ColSpa_12514 [Colletotrichum spaethianum]